MLEEQLTAATEALRLAQRRLADTQQLARTGSWELDLKSNVLWWSDETYRLFELDPARFEASYEAFLSLVHPDDREAVNRAYSDSVARRRPYEVVHRLVMPDGRVKHVREVGRTVYGEDGTPTLSVGSVQDVTDRVAADDRLRATEQRFRALIEHSTDVIAVVGADRCIRFVNETFKDLLGRSAEAWVGRDVLDIVEPDDVALAGEAFTRVLAAPGSVVPWQLRVRHADGTFRCLEGTGANRVDDAAIGGLVINCRDVSDRVRAEEALRLSEERLRQVIDVAQVGIFDHDHRTGAMYWSPRQREMYGYDPEAPITLERSGSFTHPDDRERIAASVRRAHDPAGDGVWSVEHRIVRPDGSVRWLMARAQTAFEGEGADRRPVRTVGAVIDVTHLHAADEAMRVKDQAIATSLTPIAITDAQARIVYVNPAFLRAWRYDSEAEVLGRTPLDLSVPERTRQFVQRLLQEGSLQGELVARRKDGTTFDIMLSANAVYDAQGRVTHLMASFLDVTESKRMQAQLLQAQKMESVGRLAGGIAHDFNNLLTVIKGYADLGRASLDSRDPLHDSLTQVSAAADSAASLTQQLLAFSRTQIIHPQVLDLNEVIGRVERMLARLLGEDVELRVVPGAGVGKVRFDPNQCEQILINLAVNARDAMPEGGTLTIETAAVAFDEAYARAHRGVQVGDYVMLAVSDTGVGMDQEVKAHLFEPFFTTKGVGRGTGLGLSMVFGAVAQNSGHIEVYSEVGHGTTFKVYLPLVADVAQAPVTPQRAASPLGGDETILLVEDDDAVRGFAASVLTRAGYRVHAFRTPKAALKALDSSQPIHLLLSDVIMPGMNGRTLAEQVVERHPAIRVLFASGYTDDVIVHHGVLEPGVEFLAKPYSVDTLTRRVREVLDRR